MFDGKVLRNVDPQSPFRDPDPLGDGQKPVAFEFFLGEHLPIEKWQMLARDDVGSVIVKHQFFGLF